LFAVFEYRSSLFICPIAIAYSMGQIINSVCLCACVCLGALPRSHFLIYFRQKWHRCNNPKVRTSLLWSTSNHPFPYFAPKPPNLGREYAFSSLSRKILKLFPCRTDGRLPLSGFQSLVTLTLTWIGSYGIPLCITHRALSTYQLSLK